VFPGVPYVVSGRYRGAAAGGLTLRGTTRDGRGWTVTADAKPSDNPALTAIWARAHLRDQDDRYASATGRDLTGLERRIVDTSLRFGVLCRFTAYLAVDSRVVAEGGSGHRIVQPVEPASGWDMLSRGPSSTGAPRGHVRAAGLATAVPGDGPRPQAAGYPVQGFKARRDGALVPRPSPGKAPQRSDAAEVCEFDELSNEGLPAAADAAPASPATNAGDLAALAGREAQRLRDLADRPAYERREALEDLGSRLAALAASGPLRELAETLRPETILSRPLDELWASTLEVLDTVANGSSAPAEPDRNSSFWRHT
jgi:Ca-activated chloride channel family protein